MPETSNLDVALAMKQAVKEKSGTGTIGFVFLGLIGVAAVVSMIGDKTKTKKYKR